MGEGDDELRLGSAGEHYILGGQNVLLAEFLGRDHVRPDAAQNSPAAPCAVAAEAMAQVTRREPFLTIDGLRMSKHRMFFNPKAERDLAYKARPYPEALRTP